MHKNSDDCQDGMKRTAIEFCNPACARQSRLKVSCFRSFVAAGVVLIAVLGLDMQGWAQQQAAGLKVNTIVSEWLAAVGGSERIGRVRNIYRTATSDEDGLEGTREEWITAHLNRKEKIDHVHDQSVTVLNARRAWLRDWNGKRQELAAYDLGVQEDTAILHSFAALEGRAGMAEYAGETTDGKAAILRFHPALGLELTYYLDKLTHLPIKAEWPSFDGPMTTTFSDWREVAGLKVPFAENQSDGVMTTELQIKQVEFNRRRTNFQPPEPGSDDTFFLTRQPETVPFDFQNKHIIFETQVNGQPPMWFLMDTGSNYSIINEPRVEKFHLKSYGGLKTEGGANTASGSYVEGVTYRVGHVEVRNQRAAVLSLAGLEKVFGMPLGGLLGYDFISRFVIAIDYGKQTITFYPASYHYRGKGVAAPFFMQGQQPYMKESIMVHGEKIQALFILDVGAADTLTLTTPFVKEHNLLELIGEKRPDSRTLAGSEKEFFGGTTLRGLVDGMAFGGFQLNHIPVNLSLGAHGAYASPFFSGNIGETILSRFKRVWLDYPRNRLILQPGPDVGAPFPEHRSFGLTLLSDGPDLNIFRVTEVTRDSPAQKAGFEKGDVIAGVDSTAANQLTLGKLRELLSQEGTQHAFAVKREDKELKIQVTVEDTPISNIH
jgi:hypothetical protein